ncbi:TlpA family protein disulfide reductase [Gammaproteobacteria bacterium]|nr:TlpA family protein disulfide reductase [Gammaproteobacteria bacterium]
MKGLKGLASILLSIILMACGDEPQQESSTRVSITSLTPERTNSTISTFQDLAGNPIELSDYRGKKVFLNYWATWCAPCIREIPSIARAADILGEEEFVFLLASDESIEEISAFVREHEFAGNFIKLNTFFASHGVEGVPSTFLFNAQGEQVNTWLGAYEWDSPEILAELRN